jgi:hypothetical protein
VLYHYTSPPRFDRVWSEGFLSPAPLVVSPKMFPKKKSDYLCLAPVVQLSADPVLEPTMLLNLMVYESFFRISVPDDPAFLDLRDYCERFGYPRKWFRWFFNSGVLIGATPEAWRFSLAPIPIAQDMVCQVSFA